MLILTRSTRMRGSQTVWWADASISRAKHRETEKKSESYKESIEEERQRERLGRRIQGEDMIAR